MCNLETQSLNQDINEPLLIVVSGPSGVGKDAVLSRMKSQGRPYHFTVTSTTRVKRPNERDGVDYHFLQEQDFQQMLEGGELLEWALVYGNYYGVPKLQVTEALSRSSDVIIKTDVQGAANIRKLVPEALFIFIAPPDTQELQRRLNERMTESPETLRLRLKTAERELEEASKFDYVVVNHNGRLDQTVAELDEIIERERNRRPPRIVNL